MIGFEDVNMLNAILSYFHMFSWFQSSPSFSHCNSASSYGFTWYRANGLQNIWAQFWTTDQLPQMAAIRLQNRSGFEDLWISKSILSSDSSNKQNASFDWNSRKNCLRGGPQLPFVWVVCRAMDCGVAGIAYFHRPWNITHHETTECWVGWWCGLKEW